MTRRLLFLVADTGGAHRTFATGVARHLAAAHPGEVETAIVDPFASATSRVPRGTTRLYGPLTVHAPWAWGALWHATNSRLAAALVEQSLRILNPAMTRSVRRMDPSAIVSFHPLLACSAVRARRHLGLRAPVVSVVTDLVDVHALWACPDVDMLIVPSPVALDRCRRAGVAPERLVQIGLPVDPLFTRPGLDPATKASRRAAVGLVPDRFTVLLTGGADGSGDLVRRARLIAASDLDLGLVVVCGRNRHAERQLAGLRDRSGHPVTVRGFVDDMPDWMSVADAVVSKAGAGTVAEALCSGLPLLIVWFIPGQERGNMEWAVAGGAARYVPGDAELLRELALLAAPGSAALERMRADATRLARPAAAADIAERILSLATPAQT